MSDNIKLKVFVCRECKDNTVHTIKHEFNEGTYTTRKTVRCEICGLTNSRTIRHDDIPVWREKYEEINF